LHIFETICKDSQDGHILLVESSMSKNLPSYLTITNNLTQELEAAISTIKPDKIALLVDEHTKKHCLPFLEISFDSLIEIKSGEAQKNLNTCKLIWENLTALNFSRNSLLINLGGGVIGDMGGFAAATYKRGISFIHLPTTLLSQIDAGIGGKLGIDFGGLKNHIGVFKNPNNVIICPEFLNTLPEREIKSGFAEIIKHGLIYDSGYWEQIKEVSIDQTDRMDIIQRSVEIKNAIVERDPLEDGLRKILNFGHTLGHAIESHFLASPNYLLHGEAIAMGMILEAHLALRLEMLSQNEFEEIQTFILSHYRLPKAPELKELVSYLKQDKKNRDGGIRFALIEGIGRCTYDVEVSEELIMSSIKAYNRMKTC